VPALGFLVPMVLRDRVGAVLYADPLAPMPAAPAAPAAPDAPDVAPARAATVALPAQQSLVYVAALAIESLPFRQRDATATLAPISPVPPVPPTTEPGPAQATAAAPAAEAQREPEAAPPAPAPGLAAEPDLEAPAAPAAEAAEEAAAAASPAPPAPAAPTGPTAPAAPFGVTPASLYDSPRAPAVRETAEFPSRPLRPAAPAAPVETAAVARGGSPYLEEPAATGPGPAPAALAPVAAPATLAAPASVAAETAAPGAIAAMPAPAGESAADVVSAVAATGASENATVLLPHAALRDAGTAAPPAPIAKDLGAASAEPSASRPAETAPGTAGGLTTLRAVPPIAAAAAGAAHPAAVPPPIPFSPPAPAASAFEQLRTGPIGSGTPEVRPPTGVQGPGWAFATTRTQVSSEEGLHEEARRLARLLVSEIKLYNEEQVEAGRRNRDIYERLREDIDRSRQMYEERVDPRLVKSTDYFYQELVRILAAGDSKALGI
jgi:hypothetical protein